MTSATFLRLCAIWTIFIGVFRETSASYQAVWKQTSLDSGWVAYLATNKQGDIFSDRDSNSNNLYRTTNNGRDWIPLNLGYPEASVYCIEIDVQDRIFATIIGVDSVRSGLYMSTNNGDSWQKQSSFWVKALLTVDSGRTYYAASNKPYGIYRSVDTCKTWVKISPDENGHSYSDIAITRQGSILAPRIRYDRGGILRSTDDGLTWTVYDMGGRAYSYKLFVGKHGEILSVGNTGINRSWDNGQTWWLLVYGISLNALAMDSNGIMYAGAGGGGSDGRLYRSQDTGRTWNSWTNGLSDSSILSLIANPQGYLFAGTRHGVFQTITPLANIVGNTTTLPTAFSLLQNYPNPFNPSTIIPYALPIREHVTLTIQNILGQVIATLVNEDKSAGEHSVIWNGEHFPSGIYLATMKAGRYSATRKILLIR